MIVNEIVLACWAVESTRTPAGPRTIPRRSIKTLKDLVVERPAVLTREKRRQESPDARPGSIGCARTVAGLSITALLSDRGAISCFPAETLTDL
jgi:hypothetical protein